VPEKLKGTLGELPPEQQKLLSQLYQLSTQHPDARVMSWQELQSAANLYEVRHFFDIQHGCIDGVSRVARTMCEM
jgi:hypothetical protein